MPVPPKESIGGRVKTMLDVQKSNLIAEEIEVSEFIMSADFEPSYDDDFKIYIKERWYLIQDMKAKIDALDLTLS